MNKLHKKMKIIITSFAGLIWCLSFVFAGTMMFMKGNDIAQKIFVGSGMTESSHFTGGEIIDTREVAHFNVQTHELVWEGLREKGRRGSIQIDWIYKNDPRKVENFEIYHPYYDEPLAQISIDPETEEIEFSAIHPDVLGLMDMSTIAGWGYSVTEIGKRALLSDDKRVSVRLIVARERDENK